MDGEKRRRMATSVVERHTARFGERLTRDSHSALHSGLFTEQAALLMTASPRKWSPAQHRAARQQRRKGTGAAGGTFGEHTPATGANSRQRSQRARANWSSAAERLAWALAWQARRLAAQSGIAPGSERPHPLART